MEHTPGFQKHKAERLALFLQPPRLGKIRFSGWGTWIRTKAVRVRAGSSTAKLSPTSDDRFPDRLTEQVGGR